MRHRRSKVLIFGDREHLRTLAATIRFVADGPATPSSVRFHAHVEWSAGHPWLDPHTEFAVISLEA